ncbi:hypothetical protein D3C81_1168330 [compost metagenome]
MRHRSLVLLCHQTQGFVEGVPGAQCPAHGFQRIRQTLLKLGETLATIRGDFQQRQPERHKRCRQRQPPVGKEQPGQHAGSRCQDDPHQQHSISPVLMSGLLDQLCQRRHERQLLEPRLQRRQAGQVFLPQHGLHVWQMACPLQNYKSAADTLADLARLAKHRHHQPLAEEKHGNKHHAEKHQDEFTGYLAHG